MKNAGKEWEAGKKTGYIMMFFVFSIIFYCVLKLTGKLPENWNYFYVFIITITIVLTGNLLRIILEK